jgi:hypothetical protein
MTTTEFGHETTNIGVMSCHIDVWGVGPFVITHDGKSWRFEDSDRFGPALVKKNGDLLNEPYPLQESPFWFAHAVWKNQGRKVEYDGITCVWRMPKPATVRCHGRSMIVVEHGAKYGAIISAVTGKVIRKAGVPQLD